ncbi:hypothetical protein [Brachybacterium sp. GCM10030252]|uniref:hypothetical protein n=1 Tax=Brachybacterium sp. GCM10030252 TaxID=3273380 RepID=UPI0036063EA8
MRYTPCPVDGTPVDQTPPRQGRPARFCSNRCRQRDYRARRAAAPRFAACEHDGTPIEISGRGRPPRFCSDSCRVAAHRARRAVVAEAEEILRGTVDPIPAELRERDRWVRWTVTKDGRKLPLRADRNRAASSTDPHTWSSYAEARDSAVGTGVGFVLGDGIGCLDLDDALDADGNVTSAVAEAVLAANPGAWVERSMSGRGLHVFGLLAEAPGTRRPGIEVYSRARFIALTGDVFRAGALVPLVPLVTA